MDVRPDESLDRLTSRLRIIQKRRGHRAASDDTLLAWAAARAHPRAERILDLGSGKGTVAMLLLQRLPRCRVVGLEALQSSHELAVRNSLLNELTDRWVPRLGDLRDPAALSDELPFDLITGAPPFMPAGTGVLPNDRQRAAGRFELRGGVFEYAAAAARHLAPDGKVVLLMDGLYQSRNRTCQAIASAALFLRSTVAVSPHPGKDPVYLIFEAAFHPGPVRAQSLFIRETAGGRLSAEYDAVRQEMDCIPLSTTHS